MTNKTIPILGLILVAVSYSVGRYMQPPRIETKIVTQIKKVEVTHHDTTTTETTHPDGTKTTVTVDKSVDKSRTDTSSSTSTVVGDRPQWAVSVKFAPQNPTIGYFYGIEVQRRILGPIFAGGYVNTDRVVGVSLGLEF